MDVFDSEYGNLNDAQRQAVDTTEGPVLVVAGPGTGKTQLLSMRVANILKKNDVSPNNILCLTFTDNAARNMRERLSTIIGQSAYHVAIHTFHSFGGDVINQYPDLFTERQLLQQIDELGRFELLKEILEHLPHDNPLSAKVGDDFVFINDVQSAISWFKQNALSPIELAEIIDDNRRFIDASSQLLAETFAETASPKYMSKYRKFLDFVGEQASDSLRYGFPEYAQQVYKSFEIAIQSTPSDGRYAKPITAWKNQWCKKDSQNNYALKDSGINLQKFMATVSVYESLLGVMSAKGLYDFDDMIIEAVHAIESIDELRYNLQERYQYVLVDEFQDTNKAQLRMLTAMGDNPVHEGRPNIMAVGDDDQAIYAFQGAEVSNMAIFAQQYQSPKLITLEENYRSNQNILDLGKTIASQVDNRLEDIIQGAHKQLVAKQKHSINALEHTQFSSELAQYDWIADEISKLLKQGTKPQDIAVIAPRHKYLERLMPYLGHRKIPVAYERRENILDAPLIIQISTMAELIVAIAENRQDDIDSLFAQVLSYDFWEIPSEALIELSLNTYRNREHWLQTLTNHQNQLLQQIAEWFVDLSRHSQLEPMEYIIDKMIGKTDGQIADSETDDEIQVSSENPTKFSSPLRNYYFSEANYQKQTADYLTLLGQLSTLRQRLRQWQPDKTLYIKDYVSFCRLHRDAKLKIVDSNPHTQTTNAVQVMTAYKAKGLEFPVVFVINAQDEVWGPTARSRSSNVSLPKNLPLAPIGDDDNDKLRLLFVALTRAKHSLHITSYSNTLENKLSAPLSFMFDGDVSIYSSLTQKTIDKPPELKSQEILSTDWAYRFRQVIADKPSLLEPILANYKLSVTHLNNFLDVREGSGPAYFMLHNLLRFPGAISPSAAYGDAIHKTLQWLGINYRKNGKLDGQSDIHAYFEKALKHNHLKKLDYKRLLQRGTKALDTYLDVRGADFSKTDIIERGFSNEGVIINGARLNGKIDKVSFLKPSQATVIDYKTGKPSQDWRGKDDFEKVKLHKYQQQLMFYKLLVENSANFAKKVSVQSGALDFVEVSKTGSLVDKLTLEFNETDLAQYSALIGSVWQHIMDLDFPDTSAYSQNLKGIRQFEQDLIDGKI